MKKFYIFLVFILALIISVPSYAGVYGDLVGKSSFTDRSISVNDMIESLPKISGFHGWKDEAVEPGIVETIGVATIGPYSRDENLIITFHFIVETDSKKWIIVGFGMIQTHEGKRIRWICSLKEDTLEFGSLLDDFRNMNGDRFMENMIQLHLIRLESGDFTVD